jgi:uncharacterized protein
MQTPGADAWSAQHEAIKPRVRVTTDGKAVAINGAPMPQTSDSFNNFLAGVGMQTPNLHSGSTYGFNPLTRQRTLLEWAYRSSWIVGVAVDAVADDMVKMGLDWGGTLPPDDGERLEAAIRRLQIWESINQLIRWGRLYGGAISVILIDGQDPATPLRPDTVAKGQFKGLFTLDRWRVEPSLHDLVTDLGPDLGLPKFYRITGESPVYQGGRVHYSRVYRYDGVKLPWWQAVTENLWGLSVIERLWPQLTALDSTTEGTAQLVYRAYLRIVKLAGLKQLAAQSEGSQLGLQKRIHMMQMFQSNEGITLLDADDDFQSIAYTFTGLDTVMLQMLQQLSGALQIPLVRLLGQSPAGLNSTGDSDWRNYYDGVHQQQENRLRRPMSRTIMVMARSEGVKLPETFNYTFQSLWQLLPKEKADIAEVITRTILSTEELGIVSPKRALEELRQSARETGIWATVTDEEIEAASEELPPAPGEVGGLGMPGERGPGGPSGEEPGQGAETGGRPRRLPVPPPTISLGRGKAAA